MGRISEGGLQDLPGALKEEKQSLPGGESASSRTPKTRSPDSLKLIGYLTEPSFRPLHVRNKNKGLDRKQDNPFPQSQQMTLLCII